MRQVPVFSNIIPLQDEDYVATEQKSYTLANNGQLRIQIIRNDIAKTITGACMRFLSRFYPPCPSFTLSHTRVCT